MKARNKRYNIIITPFAYFERKGPIEPLWHATVTKGDVAGVRSRVN